MRNVLIQKLGEKPAPQSGLGFTLISSHNTQSSNSGDGLCHDVTTGAVGLKKGEIKQKGRCESGRREHERTADRA